MKRRIIKPIILGLLLGTAIIMAPLFLFKAFLFLMLAGFLLRLFFIRKLRHFMRHQAAYAGNAGNLRTMSDEEYISIKRQQQFRNATRRDIDITD
jgi:hypothetical protein